MPNFKKMMSDGRLKLQSIKQRAITMFRGLSQRPGKLKELVKAWPRRKRFIMFGLGSFSLILFLIFIYYAVAFISISPVEMSLARLRESINQESVCHEDCSLRRLGWEREISANLAPTAKNFRLARRLSRRLENYFNDRQTRAELKIEIIKLYSLASGNGSVSGNGLASGGNQAASVYPAASGYPAPRFLSDYLFLEDGDPAIQSRIIASFDFASPSSSLDYYFSLLKSERPFVLKQEVIRALSSLPDKEKLFKEAQLSDLEEILFSSDSEEKYRQALIPLLSDYYLLFPEPSARLLEKVYYPDSGLDNISRLLAADILNSFRSDKLPLPEVSTAEWDNYYNQ